MWRCAKHSSQFLGRRLPSKRSLHLFPNCLIWFDLIEIRSRAGPEKAESGAARVMIHPAGWEEASLDGKTLFAGFAGTHDVGCSFRTVSTRGGADVRCQRELCDQAHAAG